MSAHQIVSVPVSSVPTHIVVWQESNNATSYGSSGSSEITELRKRVEELEKMVRTLAQPQPRYRSVSDILSGHQMSMSSSEVSSIAEQEEAPHQSPYFTATRVSEPVGLSVMTTPILTSSIAPTIPEIKIFEDLVEAASAKKGKKVSLNGMSFVCHTWNGETIYCEESTGRAYIDPKDAFANPDEHSIGYWDPKHGRLQQKEKILEEEQDADVDADAEINQLEEEGEEEEVVEEEEVEEEQEEVDEEKQVEEKQVEEEEEEEEEEAEEEEAEEEQAMELEEIEYKGQTYYKDAQNQVYQMDENGDLDDTPIGVWNEQKQKVLKYSK